VSSPSDPQQPAGPTPSSTQEIPVAAPAGAAPATGATSAAKQLPPHPDAAAPSAVEAAQPTGPVDFVPGLPGLGTPPVPPPAAAGSTPAPPPPVPPQQVEGTDDQAAARPGRTWPDTLEAEEVVRPARERRTSGVRDRSALLGIGLVVLSLVLLELGLAHDFGGGSYWSSVPLWSAFATVCAVLGLAAFARVLPGTGGVDAGTAWRVAAGGLVGLAVFWLLVVLKVVDSDRGFVLTAALAALGGALWIGARRSE
jgi:hypothetical protein